MHIQAGMSVVMRSLSATILAALLLGTPVAWAGAPTERLKTYVDRVLKTVERERGTAAERATIRKLADEIFDWEEMARRSLGPHWHGRTPAERREFVALFAELVERGYISRVEQYEGEQIRYTGERVEGDLAAVRTGVVTRQGTEIPIEYRMVLRDGRWLIYDVVIEGVSLVANYRSQFNSVVRRASYGDLVRRLKEKEQESAASPPGR
jgi:phospholipid transport system substrate-binding protein